MTQTALANQTGGAVASFCIFLLTTNALLRKRLRPLAGHVDAAIASGLSLQKKTYFSSLPEAEIDLIPTPVDQQAR